MLCGSGELGKEVAIELQRYGVEVVALDKYPNAPAMQIAHRSYVLSMLDGARLREIIEAEKPDYIIPEIEAIATPTLVELEKEGYNVIPTAKATLLTMNREGIRRLAAEELGLPTSPYRFAASREEFEEAVKAVGTPCVVKPVAGGSSVGVSIVNDRAELEKALSDAFKWESMIMCEKLVSGREMTVGILDGEVLPAIEIIPTEGFYDYKNKYQAGKTVELCPAPITDAEYADMADATRRGFDALRLGMYARFDYIISKDDGRAYCLEANTLPGMTPTSLLPQMAAAVGLGYTELCEKLCELAMKKG